MEKNNISSSVPRFSVSSLSGAAAVSFGGKKVSAKQRGGERKSSTLVHDVNGKNKSQYSQLTEVAPRSSSLTANTKGSIRIVGRDNRYSVPLRHVPKAINHPVIDVQFAPELFDPFDPYPPIALEKAILMYITLSLPAKNRLEAIDIKLPQHVSLSVDGNMPQTGHIRLLPEHLGLNIVVFMPYFLPEGFPASPEIELSATVIDRHKKKRVLPRVIVPVVADSFVNQPSSLRCWSAIDGDHEAATWGSAVDITVTAEFSDYDNDSKKRYLMVEAAPGWICQRADGVVCDDFLFDEKNFFFYVQLDNARLAFNDGWDSFTFHLTAPWQDTDTGQTFDPVKRPFFFLEVGAVSLDESAQIDHDAEYGYDIIAAFEEYRNAAFFGQKVPPVMARTPLLRHSSICIPFDIEGENAARHDKKRFQIFTDNAEHQPVCEQALSMIGLTEDVREEVDAMARISQLF